MFVPTFPPLRTLAAGALALLAASLGSAAEAPRNVRFTLSDQETVAFAPAQDRNLAVRIHLELAAAHLPPTIPATAELTIADGANHVLWAGSLPVSDLTARPLRLEGDLPDRAVESFLICERVTVSFATATEPHVLAFSRDRALKALGTVVPDMKGKPFFFNLPEEVPPPEPPPVNAARPIVDSFVIAILNWDREVQANLDDSKNVLARARSLWRDLRTADRLPWPKPVLKEFDALYAQSLAQNETLRQARINVRAKAKAFVQQWNTANGGTRPIVLEFYREA